MQTVPYRNAPTIGVSAAQLGAWYDQHIRVVLGLAHRMMVEREPSEQLVTAVFVEACHCGGSWAEDDVCLRLLQLTQRRGAARLRQERACCPGAGTLADRCRQTGAPLPSVERRPRLLVEAAYYEGCTCNELADRFGLTVDRVAVELRAGMFELAQVANRRSHAGVR